ncbi:MAG: HAMP domain-containing sensor histidine kinase [Elainellaceae cyanobacterium]
MTPHGSSQQQVHTPPSAQTRIRADQRPTQFVSLRVKLLVGFSMIFSIVFAGAFYWFYTFTTDKTITRLRDDLRSTLEGAVKGMDVDELTALYNEGQRNEKGFSDDPRYQNQMEWFETVKSIEPRAWLYSFVVDQPSEVQSIGTSAVFSSTSNLSSTSHNQTANGRSMVDLSKIETVYLVDLWSNYDPKKAVKFLQSDTTSSRAVQVMESGQLIEEPHIYSDEWGTWMSAFAPLKNDEGEVVAILGLDIEADYVFHLQERIRNRVLTSFIITYGILFVLIYFLSGILTRNLTNLTRSAELIAAGNYDQSLNLRQNLRQSAIGDRPNHHPLLKPVHKFSRRVKTSLRDEMNILAQAFESMVNSIRTREQQIREGKQIEDEIRHALQVERELNELKSNFVSIVSHEFRTPLTVLRTSVELLENYGHCASDEQKQAYFQRIRSAINNMKQLLEDVLVVGKAEAGKLDFNPTPLDVKGFCQEIVEEIQHGVGISHDIVFTCDGDFERACLDPNLLRPILTNLLSNAVKYSDKGNSVEFTITTDQRLLSFEVVDHGIGIPRKDQPHLFELFHRASNVATIRGTGLGLSIVQQCVTHHEGQVSFVSKESIGTTFRVTLPLHSEPKSNSSAAA